MAVPLFPVYEQVNGEARYHEHPALKLSDAERAAGVTPVNYAYAPGWIQRYGAMGGADDSYAFYQAGLTGHEIRVPDGNWYASIDVRRDNYVMRGAGRDRTRILLPTTEVTITALSRTSNVVTVTTALAHNIWVGKSVRVQECSSASFNYGYIVLTIISATQFTCHQLNESQANASASDGFLTHGNVIDCGELCNGNAGNEYSGLVLKDFTVDGQSSLTLDPETDLTNWGVGLTKFSNFDIDIAAENCWRGGLGLFINSNFGQVRAYIFNCGFATVAPEPGFDVNSSKYFNVDVVADSCNYGTRILGNCFGISGRMIAFDATIIGHLYFSAAANENYGCDLTLIVKGGCSAAGVATSQKVRASRIKCVVQGITGIGVHETEATLPADAARSNTYHVVTRECASGSVLAYGNHGTWYVQSELDGRGASAGDFFAVNNYGDGNTFYVTVVDDVSVPMIRGIAMRSGADGNRVVSFVHNTLVSDKSDAGTGNQWPLTILYGTETWDPPNLAVGAGAVSTGITITGAAFGDQVIASWGSNLQGCITQGFVSAANTVKMTLFNAAGGGALDFGSTTINYKVIKDQ